MMLLSLIACYDNTLANKNHPRPHDSGEDSGGDTGEVDSGDTGGGGTDTRWLFMVYMDGDNSLEAYVPKDLNELERTGSGDGVEVVVQADRIDGYTEKDGDWTGTRRYHIIEDDTPEIVSPVVEDMGELDMGVPETLADFVEWASATYPAENRVIILWDHGDGWLFQAQAADSGGAPPPGIASDDTSGTMLSVANGDLAAGLATDVANNGRYSVIGFDACNMASWEVAHAMQPYAEYMSGAETTVGSEGFMYEPILAFLRATPLATTEDLAILMSQGAVEEGGELTHSAVNLDAVRDLSTQIDTLAGLALGSPAISEGLLAARDTTRGADEIWAEWYLDVGDLADNAALSEQPELAGVATDMRAALDAAVVGNFHSGDYTWTTGLTIYFDPSQRYISDYTEGAGATWSADTRWDDYLASLLPAE